jgi:[acyl-carrier-protein] S-malonyltransferase
MMLAILCSGQGGQHPGMFDLTGHADAAAELFEHAQSLLGHDPRTWLRSASPAALRENRTAQLLCTLQALSAMALLDDVLPPRRCVAGYSVGEVAAWGVAGLFQPCQTLDLINLRARAMDAASPRDAGMLFIRGLPRSAIDALCDGREAAIAIINPGDAWVIGGTNSALSEIAAQAQRQGAVRVVPVAVGVPSHTYLLTDAAASFHQSLTATTFTPARSSGTRLFSGIDGSAVLNLTDGLSKLAIQIAQPIHWAACLESCVEAGASAFLELGPGRALAEMAASAYPQLPARSLDDFRSRQGVVDWLARIS